MRRDIPVNCCDTRYRDGTGATRFNSGVNSAARNGTITLLHARINIRKETR